MSTPVPVHEDILEGAEAISEFIFGTRQKKRKIYYLIETGRIPVFRWGNLLCARKSALLASISAQETLSTSTARSAA